MKIRTCSLIILCALALTGALASPVLAQAPACVTSNDCGANGLCGRPIGACLTAGTCVTPPAACRSTFDPVCGCNGQTYDNECFASLAGVSVAALGPCEAMACLGNGDCPGGFMCHSATGACGAVGTCGVMPTACASFMYMPVCGCDGKTYENVCMATKAGVSVALMGECPGLKCRTNKDCAEDQYCMRPGQSCNGNGRCEPRPEVCTFIYAPVCGCDGEIYASSCIAAEAGVSVANAGETCRGNR